MGTESALQDRLRGHAKAFDGLLSLIPAKMYYGEENDEDQWKKKKQSKAEASMARRNKLDPDSELNRSVKEVMDDQAMKKRKRDQNGADDDDEWSDVDGVDHEKPRQGMKAKTAKDVGKKQKTAADEPPQMTEKEKRNEEKKQRKKAAKAERAAIREEEEAYQRQAIKGVNKIKLGDRRPNPKAANGNVSSAKPKHGQSNEEGEEDTPDEASELQDIDMSRLEPVEKDGPNSDAASASPSEPQSPVFDPNGTPADSTGQTSTNTSVSSTTPASEKPKHIKIPEDTSHLRARLAARIQALRDARKADRDDKPIRTRQELIEDRRKKQAERKAHKKELREKAKLAEDEKREEALASARNSPGSILSPAVDSENNFSFGRIGFGDGTQLSHDLSYVLSNDKKKGPSDPKTALQKLENQKKRLQNMDAEKRKEVEEKEAWLTARKRVDGEKVRDDEKMLKKAVKRKDHTKKKSEKEWKNRAEGVTKSIAERQKKREANLKKRRDEKLLGKVAKRKGIKRKTARAGFEGALKVGGKRK